jgi:RNA polymerase sigma-70 factor (family 1)
MGLNRKTEKILFTRAKEGDADSFEILFNYYYPRLCTYAAIFVKYPDVAEEIVQETFIRIWEKRTMISIRTTFKAYLYRSVHNNCINYLKVKKYLSDKDETFRNEVLKQSELNTRNLDAGIIDKIVSEEFETEFRKALKSLPVQCLEVFMMCRDEKLSYSETAEKMGISVNTVKTQMKRALSKLKDVLEKNFKR